MTALSDKCLRCAQCGAPLDSSENEPGCLNCLLGGGLSEPATPDRRFQHYEICLREDGAILDELGRGAMGVTYRALDTNLDSFVALKFISPRYSDDAKARERFRREARAAAQLRHPNVASVFHFGEAASGHCFYAMELVEGETLESRVRRAGRLPAATVLEIAAQVGRALMAAEQLGLVHRDLKPSNIMLLEHSEGEAPFVKVIDFGLARLAHLDPGISAPTHASFSGTPGFASPEQLAGDDGALDVRSDIYSLGTTLWFALCGRKPFPGSDRTELYAQQLSRPLPIEQLVEAKVPSPVIALLRSMRTQDPAGRPQSARDLLAAIRRAREGLERKPARRKGIIAAAAAALMIGGLTSYFIYEKFAGEQRANAELPDTAPRKGIAVLPFENVSGSAEDAYLVEGIKDEIQARLSKIATLKVIARTSTQGYKSAPERLPEVGRKLGVANILEGSVQKVGGTVRVTVRLMEAANDRELWSETYDRKLTNLFETEGEIAQRAAVALSATLTGSEKRAVEAKPTENIEAYQAYLKGRYFWNKRSADGYKLAFGHFNKAIEFDPVYAQAYAGLADAYLFLASVSLNPKEMVMKGRAALKKALDLNDTLAEAHASLGLTAMNFDRDWLAAESEFRRAIELDPNCVTAHQWYGDFLGFMGRFDQAFTELNRAHELDPLSVIIASDIAEIHFFARRYDQAVEEFQNALEMDPDFAVAHGLLALTYCLKGMPQEAVAELRKIKEAEENPMYLCWMVYAYAQAGYRNEALAALDWLKNLSSRIYVHPLWMATAYTGLGDKEQAIEWFERDFAETGGEIVLKSPVFDSLHSDPRWPELIRRSKLPL